MNCTKSDSEKANAKKLKALIKGIDPNGGITEIIVNLSVRTVRTYSQNNENGTNTR